MAELMDQHLGKSGMVAGGDHHLIVDASAAVGVAVDQHNNVFKGNACQQVIEVVDVTRGQITVAVEGVIVGADGGVAPSAQMGHTGTSLKRLGSNGHDIETALERLERLTGKQGINSTLAVIVELTHLGMGIALGDNGQVDA